MHRLLFILLVLLPMASFAADDVNDKSLIRLAATTSIENSGLLEYLLPFFLKRHPHKIDLSIAGSGKALRLGRTGAADIVWVHSPPAEKKFIEQGYGVNRQTIMRNDFVLVGPSRDPGNIGSSSNIIEAFQLIASRELLFVSRADDSGTNKKELSIWQQAQVDPYGTDWYLESGLGTAASLALAQQEGAYIMIDRATFEVRHDEGVRIILEDPVRLFNPYSVIAINPGKVKGVNDEGANRLIDWLVSQEGQELIRGYAHRGRQLYFPTKFNGEQGSSVRQSDNIQ